MREWAVSFLWAVGVALALVVGLSVAIGAIVGVFLAGFFVIGPVATSCVVTLGVLTVIVRDVRRGL